MKKTTLLLALTTLVCDLNVPPAQEPLRADRVRLAIQPRASNLELGRLNEHVVPVTEVGRSQRLAGPDAVPEGLSAPDWSIIRQQYEQRCCSCRGRSGNFSGAQSRPAMADPF